MFGFNNNKKRAAKNGVQIVFSRQMEQIYNFNIRG
jgi:hypothetical protein